MCVLARKHFDVKRTLGVSYEAEKKLPGKLCVKVADLFSGNFKVIAEI